MPSVGLGWPSGENPTSSLSLSNDDDDDDNDNNYNNNYNNNNNNNDDDHNNDDDNNINNDDDDDNNGSSSSSNSNADNDNDDKNNNIERRNSGFLHLHSRGQGETAWKSRATQALITLSMHVVCHVARKDSSAFTFKRVKSAFIKALFHWLKPLTDEREEKTGLP